MWLLARYVLALLAALQLGSIPAAHAQDAAYRGRPVQEVMEELRAAGAPLVYSSNLVPSTLRVREEPVSAEPLALAREILGPFGLTVREMDGVWLVVRAAVLATPPAPGRLRVTVTAADTGAAVRGATVQLDAPSGITLPAATGSAEFADVPAGRHTLTARAPGYLRERTTVTVGAGATANIAVPLLVATPQLDEITVTASRYELDGGVQPSDRFFSRDEIESLSELGDDTLRIAHRLPGIAAVEFSARSHVRGGAADEMAVVLDGIELMEPFHLRDYQSVFSAIDQRIVENVHIYSGGFPAAYGEALSGLTTIEPLVPAEPLRHEVGLSLLQTSALSTGRFAADKGEWVLSLRRGNVDRILSSGLGEPAYRDAFFHLGGQVAPKHTLSINGVALDDDIFLTPGDEAGRTEQGATSTASEQIWLNLGSSWTDRLTSRTLLHTTNVDTRRTALIDIPAEIVGDVDDARELRGFGVKQDWEWRRSDRQLITAGFAAETLDAEYRYASSATARGALATLAGRPADGSRAAALAPSGDSYGLYFSDRVRITDRVIAELGLRWDRQTYLPSGDDSQLTPRASVLYRLGGKTDLRLSYGRYHQSEGLLDLQIEDGVVDFAPAQRASHAIVGIEHRFGRGLQLRVEAFRKLTRTARPRYENLFDPFVLAPEIRPGRIEVRPDRAEARGVEWLLDGAEPLSWWVGYSLSRTEDVVGGRHEPRSWDQRHALTGGITWQTGAWTLSASTTYHTGWPVTAIVLAPGAAPTVLAGPRNAERLPTLRRLDLRADRTVTIGKSTLDVFAELTNATNRRNPCCVAYQPIALQDGTVTLPRDERAGLPLLVNIGLLWEF